MELEVAAAATAAKTRLGHLARVGHPFSPILSVDLPYLQSTKVHTREVLH